MTIAVSFLYTKHEVLETLFANNLFFSKGLYLGHGFWEYIN